MWKAWVGCGGGDVCGGDICGGDGGGDCGSGGGGVGNIDDSLGLTNYWDITIIIR